VLRRHPGHLGYNGFGQLGNNDFSGTSKLVPVAVNMANGTSALFGKTITALAAGEHHSLAQCSDGALAAWGYNGIGQVGDNSTFGRFVPVAVSSTPLAAGERFILGTSGHSASHTLAIAAALPPPPPPAPEVEVELVGSETNTPLTNEADTVPFGTVAVGSTTTQTFLIKNTGTASLDNIEVSLDLGDPDHEQFSVTRPTENSIDPDGSRTFTVTYCTQWRGQPVPPRFGWRGDDGDESTFSVELTGTAELVPEITVRDGLTPILTNAEVELGNVIQGDFVERTFTIAKYWCGRPDRLSGHDSEHICGSRFLADCFRGSDLGNEHCQHFHHPLPTVTARRARDHDCRGQQ